MRFVSPPLALVASWLLCSLPPAMPALAGDPIPTDFFDLDLSELSNVIVTIASTREEMIPDTPAIVSRYNADEMEKMGLRNLKEMLAFIPGVVVQDALIGTTPIMIRGLVEAFNQKILFLIDDVPYFQPGHSDIPLHGVPIEAIDHIEVIRGPGAVYYGTNASAGVIKVVTKQALGKEVTFTARSNDMTNLGGRLSHNLNDKINFSLAFESQKDDGYDATYTGLPAPPTAPADTTVNAEVPKKERKNSLLAKLNLGETNFMGQIYESMVTGVNDHGYGINLGEAEYQGYMVHGDHSLKIASARVKIFSDYNVFHPEIEGENFYPGVTLGGVRFSSDGEDNYRWRSGANLEYSLHHNLHLFSGAEYERRATGAFKRFNAITNQEAPSAIIDANKMTEKSLFAQLDYNYQAFRFLAGGRYTHNTKSGEKLSPRAAAIYKFNRNQSIKLLYSEGFNSPNFIQEGANESGLVSSAPDLVAESVKTTDLAYTYTAGRSLLVANVYYLQAEDFIERKKDGGIITFSNAQNFERYGAELDLQHGVGAWKIFTNLAYHHQGDREIDNDEIAKFAPRFTACLGGFYTFLAHHNLGGSLRLIGERLRADTQNIINLDYKYTRANYELFVTLRNLLDQEINNPDTSNFSAEPLIPGEARFNVAVGGKYHF